MIAVSLVLVLFLRDRVISRPEAAILATGIIAYIILSVHLSRKENASADIPVSTGKSPLLDLLFVVAGLGMLIAGSNLLVNGTVKLATYLGVSQAVIGLTIVAAGTSFPELATSVVAGIRGEDDIAIGNIIGSNIFNILCILGVAPFFGQVKTGGIQVLDLAFMLGTSALLLPLMWPKLRIGRAGGMLLVLLYGSYLFLIWPK